MIDGMIPIEKREQEKTRKNKSAGVVSSALVPNGKFGTRGTSMQNIKMQVQP